MEEGYSSNNTNFRVNGCLLRRNCGMYKIHCSTSGGHTRRCVTAAIRRLVRDTKDGCVRDCALSKFGTVGHGRGCLIANAPYRVSSFHQCVQGFHYRSGFILLSFFYRKMPSVLT